MTAIRSGRTTRMIADAVRLAKQGRAVYIIAASARDVERIVSLLPKDDTSIKVGVPESCGNFDMDSMRLRGAHPNCVVLVDHYAIESRYGPMLEMLHRYDKEMAP